MKTYSAKAAEIKRELHVIDASGQILGRLASQIAGLLMEKISRCLPPTLIPEISSS